MNIFTVTITKRSLPVYFRSLEFRMSYWTWIIRDILQEFFNENAAYRELKIWLLRT